MLYTCTRVEYTCSIDVEDIVAYNNTHQKIYLYIILLFYLFTFHIHTIVGWEGI